MPRELDHVTSPRGDVMAMVDGTGTGAFVDDLDDDGFLDIVLPNLSGESSVFWNDGGLNFTRATLDDGRFRQAISADVDDDGDRDVLLSTGIGPPIAYLNQADSGAPRSFVRSEFRTRAVAFSMAPGDLDGNGSVEIVTGSYNAELTQNRDQRVLTGTDVGVAVHEPDGATLASGVPTTFLTESAQALATLVVDINGDGLDDVVVGNDLGTPDRIWLGDATLPGVDGLTVTELFDVTSLSTMSIDVADLDNDGDRDIVSTDMARMPGESDEVWASVEADIEQARVDEIQQPRNVVQLADGSSFEEQAVDFGVDATGWSWSGLLGDLDNDGFVDLYVVNGMQAVGIFESLPDGELVEANQAFRNTGDGFEPMAAWNLDATAGGRGMAQGDLDGDGDLDIVINNLGTPAVLWENQVCGGSSIIVEPVWTGTQNIDALAAVVDVEIADETTRTVAITGTRGYISTSATQAHIGLAEGTEPQNVTIIWPDGAVTDLGDVASGTTVRAERTVGPLDTRSSGDGQ